jgi:hypothetical protein
MKNKYWKLSVLKGDKYFVKVVCIPSEQDAIILANTLIAKGMVVRISKQI